MQITLNAQQQEYLTSCMLKCADWAALGEEGNLELDIVTNILHQLENSKDNTEVAIEETLATIGTAIKQICRVSSMNQYLSQLMDIEDRLTRELRDYRKNRKG